MQREKDRELEMKVRHDLEEDQRMKWAEGNTFSEGDFVRYNGRSWIVEETETDMDKGTLYFLRGDDGDESQAFGHEMEMLEKKEGDDK